MPRVSRSVVVAAILAVGCGAGTLEEAPTLGETSQAVANGEDDPTQHPYVVQIGFPGGACSGVLVTPGWVVTSNHCITGKVRGAGCTVATNLGVGWPWHRADDLPATIALVSGNAAKHRLSLTIFQGGSKVATCRYAPAAAGEGFVFDRCDGAKAKLGALDAFQATRVSLRVESGERKGPRTSVRAVLAPCAGAGCATSLSMNDVF